MQSCTGARPKTPFSAPVVVGQHVFSAQRGLVAQICNLPYRRFVIGRGPESSRRTGTCLRAAEYNSAIQQITNLRYAAHYPWSTNLDRNAASDQNDNMSATVSVPKKVWTEADLEALPDDGYNMKSSMANWS